MLSRRNIRRLRSFVRATTGRLLVAVYLFSALGLPIPSLAADVAGPVYPCQGSRCGCRTAEQCWKSCCCHTAAERLAWAEQHGVTPPGYLVAAAQKEKPVVTRTCCASRSCSSPSPAPAPAVEAAEAPSTKLTWVSVIEAQRCRGESPARHHVPISLPPQPPVDRVTFEPCDRPLFLAHSPTLPSASLAPPVPPPWIA